MYYLYFIDDFGRTSLEIESNSKERIIKSTKELLNNIEPNKNKYLMITPREIPVYQPEKYAKNKEK